MASISIRVKEIHCASCAHTIRIALGRLDGVRTVVPSAERNGVRVNFDEAKLSEDRLRAALGEVGYEPLD